jgi:hypothetical protein
VVCAVRLTQNEKDVGQRVEAGLMESGRGSRRWKRSRGTSASGGCGGRRAANDALAGQLEAAKPRDIICGAELRVFGSREEREEVARKQQGIVRCGGKPNKDVEGRQSQIEEGMLRRREAPSSGRRCSGWLRRGEKASTG